VPSAATAAKPSQGSTCRQIAALMDAAMQFVPRDRGEAVVRKWLTRRDIEQMSEERMLAMAADAMLLSADLLLSQPNLIGSTAFDRLARSRSGAPTAVKALIAVLCKARFRLLRVEGDTQLPEVSMRDVVSGHALRFIDAELPSLAIGTTLFVRVVMLGDELCCPAGAITPLDPAAFEVAREHAAAGAQGASASARWAEAVYGHVVRHGTLDVPGLNRPAEDADAEDEPFETDSPLSALASAWAALADGTPSASLLQHTRQLANLPSILDALEAAVSRRDARQEPMANRVRTPSAGVDGNYPAS